MKEERVRKFAAKALVAFVAIMALLTWTSRALTDMTVANVSVTTAVRGSLEMRIDANGTLVAASSEPVFMDRSLRVTSVDVTVGDQVEAGDLLFTLDISSVQEQLLSEEESYQKQLLSYEKSRLTTATAPSTAVEEAERTLTRAQENKQTVEKQQQDSIDAAARAITEAQEALVKAQYNYNVTLAETAQSFQKAVQEAQSAYDEALSKYNAARSAPTVTPDPDDPDSGGQSAATDLTQLSNALSKAQEALYTAQADAAGQTSAFAKKMESAQSAVENAQKTLTSKEEALGKAYEDREKALRDSDRSLEDARSTLDKQIASAEVSAKNESISNKQKSLDSQSTQIDIAARERTIEELKAFIEGGGRVLAPVSGRVMAVTVSVGSNTSTNNSCVDIATGESVQLKAQIDSDDEDMLEVGGEVTVRTADNKDYTGVVTEINDVVGNAQKREVVVLLPGDAGQPGETAQLRYRSRTAQYDAVLSLSALRSDDDGDFILVAYTESGAMGTTTTARRVDITVLEQDSARMAVRAGIGNNDRVITRSDRSIDDGDRIYVEE